MLFVEWFCFIDSAFDVSLPFLIIFFSIILNQFHFFCTLLYILHWRCLLLFLIIIFLIPYFFPPLLFTFLLPSANQLILLLFFHFPGTYRRFCEHHATFPFILTEIGLVSRLEVQTNITSYLYDAECRLYVILSHSIIPHQILHILILPTSNLFSLYCTHISSIFIESNLLLKNKIKSSLDTENVVPIKCSEKY